MRVPYAAISPEEQLLREREGRAAPNLQLAVANAPEVARTQVEFLRATTANLDLRLRELAILEVARILRNGYCWGHHVPVALDLGCTAEQLSALRDGDHSLFDESDQQVLRFAGHIESQTLRDDDWTALSARLSDSEMVALVVLVGYYCSMSRIQSALQVPQDEGFGEMDVP